jgi:hypothetical protein
MDSLAQLALMTKAKLVFEGPGTFLSFPATTPLSYSPEQLKFAQITSPPGMLVFSEFSRLTNSLPGGVIFQPSLDSMLWDVYQGMLQNAQVAQGGLTAQQQADLHAADAFLYTQDSQGNRTDSPALIAYKQYEQVWILATQNYKAQQVTALASNDPNVQAQWQNTDEPLARAQVQAAESAWETKGFKAQVEQAEQVETTCAALSPQLKWHSWTAQCNPDIDFLTDPNNQTFGPTAYSPADITDQTNWPTFSITGPEIPQLISQAPQELADLFGTTSGNSSIDSLSFEFCSVVLNRPWFRAEAFDARFWRFSDPSIQLNDGNNPANGEWPAYITGLVLARNIAEAMHTATGAVQHQPVMVFPPVLLRASPLPVYRPLPISIQPHRIIRQPGPSPVLERAPVISGPVLRPMEVASLRPAEIAPLVAAAPPAMARLRSATFVSLGLPKAPLETVPIGQVTSGGTSGSAGAAPAPSPQPSPETTQVSILAFICKRLPKCPNPDPALNWGPGT